MILSFGKELRHNMLIVTEDNLLHFYNLKVLAVQEICIIIKKIQTWFWKV